MEITENSALRDQFVGLTKLLKTHHSLWKQRAFKQHSLSWQSEYPDLSRALLELPGDHVERLNDDFFALTEWMSSFLDFAPELYELSQLPVLPSKPLQDYPPGFDRDIPGRKWQQIEAFSSVALDSELPLLEWCSGKAHLGRCLSYQRKQSVTSLEWDKDLVAEAKRLAVRAEIPVEPICCDVMDSAVLGFLPQKHAVALHACGDLHRTLLETGVAESAPAISLAPCCYHKTEDAHYRPFSKLAKEAGLCLERDELRTSLQETVTAPAGDRRRRTALRSWRLGFSIVAREELGITEYLPIPSLPNSLLRGDFRGFCAHVAELKQLNLPAGLDFGLYEKLGQQRLRLVESLDLVRLLFRRPLEVWLVLDRALLLVEQGYCVRVGEFCERALTPRNILIEGHKP